MFELAQAAETKASDSRISIPLIVRDWPEPGLGMSGEPPDVSPNVPH